MKNKNCELCNGTGWYGDNGPGIRGNREYVPCEHCNPKADGDYAVLGDGWRDARKELPDPPCLAYWMDGRYTVLEDGDRISYAVFGHPDHQVIYWRPLPDPPASA